MSCVKILNEYFRFISNCTSLKLSMFMKNNVFHKHANFHWNNTGKTREICIWSYHLSRKFSLGALWIRAHNKLGSQKLPVTSSISHLIKTGFHKATRVEIMLKLKISVSHIDFNFDCHSTTVLSACETWNVSQANQVIVQWQYNWMRYQMLKFWVRARSWVALWMGLELDYLSHLAQWLRH